MSGKNGNWVEDKDGWHKSETSHEKGNAGYFSRPIPPVRDGATGYPIGKDGKIDWNAALKEVEKKNGG